LNSVNVKGIVNYITTTFRGEILLISMDKTVAIQTGEEVVGMLI